ncbi:MAG: Acyl-CoA dehydrogenase, partial [Aeromicrobium sp.]|nr:Acyl-CoA dehydrogenase [Aeromicrobium sp.]
EKRSPESTVRETMATELGHDPDLWQSFAREIGLQGLAVPESLGGGGVGWVELGVVFEELGRSLAATPFLATVGLGLSTLLEAGDDDASAAWLPQIADGSLIATAAVLGSPRVEISDVPLEAIESEGSWRLTGVEHHVLDGLAAALVLVVARTGRGVSLFAVTDFAAVERTSLSTSDLTRRFATLTFDGAVATLIGASGAGLEIVERARRRATALLACEQVGGAAAALDMAVDYARTREQFGRPIGSFQAVKHKCADMLVSLETARSAAWALVRAIDAEADPDELELIASIARTVCSESFEACASGSVQVHGGIGFTWEHPAHLYVKRSRGSSVLLGTPREHRSALVHLVPALHPDPTDATPRVQQGAAS